LLVLYIIYQYWHYSGHAVNLQYASVCYIFTPYVLHGVQFNDIKGNKKGKIMMYVSVLNNFLNITLWSFHRSVNGDSSLPSRGALLSGKHRIAGCWRCRHYTQLKCWQLFTSGY